MRYQTSQRNRRTLLPIIMLALAALLPVPISGSSEPRTELELTAAERQWLADHPVIRVSGPQAFPPFHSVAEDGTISGMAADYLEEIGAMAGFSLTPAPKMDWPRVLETIAARNIDLLSCSAITPQRRQYLSFTRPHLSFPLVIINRKNDLFVADLDSLHQKRIAIVRGNAVYGWLQEQQLEFEPIFVDTPLAALTAVSLGQADGCIENLAAASYLIEKEGLSNLQVAAPTPFADFALAIGVRSDWPELVSILDKGLAAIDRQTHNQIRQRWIAVRYEHGLSAEDILRWVLPVGGVGALLVALFYGWNRRLAREIRERRQAEQAREQLISELTGALVEIKTLRGILPICSQCKKIRDDQGYWTKLETYIADHSEADFSHSLCPECNRDLYGEEAWYRNRTQAPRPQSGRHGTSG